MRSKAKHFSPVSYLNNYWLVYIKFRPQGRHSKNCQQNRKILDSIPRVFCWNTQLPYQPLNCMCSGAGLYGNYFSLHSLYLQINTIILIARIWTLFLTYSYAAPILPGRVHYMAKIVLWSCKRIWLVGNAKLLRIHVIIWRDVQELQIQSVFRPKNNILSIMGKHMRSLFKRTI